MPQPKYVYLVHVTQDSHVGAIKHAEYDQVVAERWAQQWSVDDGVTHAEVTRFEVGVMGTRKAISVWVAGERSKTPWRTGEWRSIHPDGQH